MQTKKLSNGLTIIVHQEPTLKNAVVNVLYKVGSVHEEKDNTGMAHFLEHMMFEGSENHPEFDTELQEMMGENNAFTTQDYTCYYQTILTIHLQKILEIEYDRAANLSLDIEKIKLQQKVILEEFKETSLNPPLSDAWHYIQKMNFKNSYSWPVIGKKLKHIKDFKPEVIRDFYTQQYIAENIVISIISEKPEAEVLELTTSIFNQLPKSKLDKLEIDITKKTKKIGSKQLKRKNISSPHFFLTFHIGDFDSKDYFLADMASDLLTNGESSLLYQSLITENQLCSEINSYTTDNKACNLLIIEGKLNALVEFEQVYSEIQRILNDLKSNGISDLKFETLYNKSLTYWAFYHYTPSQLAQNMAIFNYCAEIEDPKLFIDSIYCSINQIELETYIAKNLTLNECSILEYLPS
jgi:zinc protease